MFVCAAGMSADHHVQDKAALSRIFTMKMDLTSTDFYYFCVKEVPCGGEPRSP